MNRKILPVVAICFFFTSLSIVIFISTFSFVRLGDFTSVPLVYTNQASADVLDFYTGIQNYLEAGSIYENKRRGFPTIADYSKFPQFETFNLWLFKLIASFGVGTFGVVNIFLFVSTVLALNICAFVLYSTSRERSINNLVLAYVLGISWVFSPYIIFQMKYGHIFLSNLIIVPMSFYVCSARMGIYRSFIFGLISSGFGIYYMFFSGLVFLVSQFYYYSSAKKIASNVVAFCFAALLLTSSTVYVYFMSNMEGSIVTRNEDGALIFGLKPILMLLPAQYQIFSNEVRSYLLNATSYFNAIEVHSSSLGVPLIFVLIFATLDRIAKPRQLHEISKFSLCVVLVIIIISTSDLLSIFVGMLSGGYLRTLTRGSIFIAFALTLFAFNSIVKFDVLRKNILITLTLITIASQISSNRNFLKYDYENYIDDQVVTNFFRNASANLLEFPLLRYPEASVYGLSYQHLVPLLSPNNVNISYGISGKNFELYSKEIAEAFDNRDIEGVKALGYTHVMIDLRGFPDSLRSEPPILSYLSSICEPVTLGKFRIVFELNKCN